GVPRPEFPTMFPTYPTKRFHVRPPAIRLPVTPSEEHLASRAAPTLCLNRLVWIAGLVMPLAAAAGPSRNVAAVHPLEPLWTNELRAAIEVLLKERRVSTNTLFPLVTLQEPVKEKVLTWQPGPMVPREAFVITYELDTHGTHEAIVDLDQSRVTA